MREGARHRRSFRALCAGLAIVSVSASIAAGFFACGVSGVRGEELHAPEPPPEILAHLQVVPHAPGPNANLSAVRWTVTRSETVEQLADRWGVSRKVLVALNPELRGRKKVEPGERWVVSRDEGAFSRSIGSPNRGRVEHAIAFPEGSGWQLRPFRHRAYGTKQTVEHLANILREFNANYPDVPPLMLGDIGNRRGGKAPPHKSHQSGRDVDLGYVVEQPPGGYGRWARVDFGTFDAERNWALMRMMLTSGVVDHIFVDRRLQKPLMEAAKADLTDVELPRYFAIAATGKRAQAAAYISQWAGHDDHMHIRFGCSEVDLGCEGVPQRRKSSRSTQSRKKGSATKAR